MDGFSTSEEEAVMNELGQIGQEEQTTETQTAESESADGGNENPDAAAADEQEQGKEAAAAVEVPKKSAAELRKGLEQATPAPSPRPPAPPFASREAFLDALEQDPEATVRKLVAAELAPLHQERQLAALEKNIAPIAETYEQLHTEDGAAAFFAKVTEIASELGNPGLVRNPSARILKMAAEELWGSSQAKTFAAGQEQGRAAAEAARAAKKAVAANPTGKAPAAAQSPEDEVADAILSAGRRGDWFE